MPNAKSITLDPRPIDFKRPIVGRVYTIDRTFHVWRA